MEYKKMMETVLETAVGCASRGAGYAQQRVVLEEVARKVFNRDSFVSPPNINQEQEILTCWHDLFREGRLSWGYNLENPDAPFFHVPDPQRLKS